MAGRQWTCPDRTIGGYPASLQIRCEAPTFRGEIAGRLATGTVAALTAEASVGHLRTVIVDLVGPLDLVAENEDFELVVSWSALRVSASGLPAAPREGRLEARRLAVTLTTRDTGVFNARAAGLEGRANLVADEGTAPDDVAFSLAASGLTAPTIDGFVGRSESADVGAEGTLGHATLLRAPTVRRLEAWRQAGGMLDFRMLRVVRGGFNGQASGNLSLDDAHRVTGRLDTALTGFGPLAARFGIPVAGMQLGGLLSSLLGGGKTAVASPASNAEALRLPILLKAGRLLVGPFPIPVRLDPLY